MSEEKKILYVEDDQTLGYLTADSLRLKGFDVTICEDGFVALEIFNKQEFDICVLDVMLPKMDGFELARKIRVVNQEIPIIFLTAKSMLEDKLEGLKLGGDDYIIKPFSIEELVLKIEIFLKRKRIQPKDENSSYQIGKYNLYCEKLILSIGKKEQRLTSKEAELIRYFIENKNTILKRDDILLNIWGEDDYFLGRSLDVFISRLRKYFNADPSIKIENVHGVGFIFRDNKIGD
jgi:DNA-binding response OmpR family regulator